MNFAQIVQMRVISLHSRHNGHNGADQRKHQSSASLAICAGNSPVTGEFPAQMSSNAENISIWWRHHVVLAYKLIASISLFAVN